MKLVTLKNVTNGFEIEDNEIVLLKKTNNLLKLTRSEWGTDTKNPTDSMIFDYNKLYYMAGSGYIRPNPGTLNETITNSSISFTQGSSSWWGIGFPIEVKPNTKYTISGLRTDGDVTKFIYTLYGTDGLFESYAQVDSNASVLNPQITITTGANTKTLVVLICGVTSGTTISMTNIQVEEGQSKTEFEPYGYKSENYEIYLFGSSPEPQVIYGVKLDRTLDSNQPLGNSWATYTDDAVGLNGAYMDFTNDVFVDNGWYNRWPFNQIRPCIVKDGQVVGYLKKDNYAQYEDGTSAPITDRTAGNVMIEIPKIYYKISADSQYNYIQISNQPFTESCCLAHVYKGEELSKIYIDAYLSGASDYETHGPYSISGINPAPEYFSMGYETVYPTIKSFRGNRCEPLNYNIHTLIGCLTAIMFKSTNCRISLGKGLYKYSENGVTTGILDNKGFCYGQNTNANGNNTLGRIKLFGMEDYYGAKYTYCVGLYFDSNLNYRIINPYDSTQEYSVTGLTNLPVFDPGSTDLLPLPQSSSLIPVKITGINTLGFARTNENTSATDVSSDSDVGFCSKTKYSNNTYTAGLIATGFNNDAGVYAFQTFSVSTTSRRAFRIVYFPIEN